MKKAVIIGGGVIVLAAAIASPYFCGSAIENKFDEKVTEIQLGLQQIDPGFKFKKSKYVKGWFSSTATTTLTIDGQQLAINHNISHGPWSYFGLGKIESTLAYNDQQKKLVEQLFDNKQPLVITTNIGFSGYKSIQLYSAEINKKPLPSDPTAIINWGGMTGSINFEGNRLLTDIKVPELTISGKTETFQLQNMLLKSDEAYLSKDWKNAANISWAGNAVMSIDKLTISVPEYTISTAINLNVVATEGQINTVDYNSTLKFTNMELPKQLSQGITISNKDILEFGLGFNGIPKKQLAEFLDKLEAIQKSGRTPQQMELTLMAQDFAIALLQGTPSITAHGLLTSDKGELTVNAEAKLVTPDTATDLMTLVMGAENRLVITVTPSFSESLLDVAIATGRLPPLDKAEFIKNITENNRFIFNNGKFSGKFEYKQNKFYSNGQPDPELQNNLQMILPRGIF